MSRRSLRLCSALALAALTVTACGTGSLVAGLQRPDSSSSSSQTQGGPSTSGSSSSTSSSASGSATGPGAPLAFSACSDGKAPSGAVCALFTAPLDYSDPGAGTVRMRVVKLPARNQAARIGSLLTNPGGPGGSGVDFVEDGSSLFAALNQRFDIIGFDPRGIHEPDAVTCLGTSDLDAIVAADPIPDNAAERQKLIDTSKELAQACEQRSGKLLRHVGTDDVARDMDGLRASLGDPKLTYLGFSYGTSIGSHYAALFPDHIRAMVLDADVDGSISMLDQVTQQADSLEKSFNAFVDNCTSKGSACALGSDPRGTIDKMLHDLNTTPVRASDGRMVGRAEALIAVLAAMYDATEWGLFQTLFGRAARGNVDGLQLLSDLYTGRENGRYNHQIEGGTAVNCLDESAPTDVSVYDTRAAEVQKRDPHFGAAAIYGDLACAFWPVHGPDPKPLDIQNAPPILLVGATGDPATPYSWSTGLQRQIHGSVLITRQGFGHSSYDASSCIQQKVDAYLVQPSDMPSNGATCSS